MVDDNTFRDIVRNSFQRVKDDISRLEGEITQINDILSEARFFASFGKIETALTTSM